jgi:hypothetical protein
MSTSPRPGGSLRAFRLAEIPEPIRQRGKSRAILHEDNVIERLRIGLAAERPSDRIYWIPRTAWDKVMLPKNRKRGAR